ncbi:hypothetical protein AB0G15_14825 [Streptosporangium sp. NPDC023825]|uniref:hypothetical protein n=1 Tax=Streptosporangium sp. NPDC023825 TaxID=3154909 RepID=UPI003430D7B1
MRVRVKFRYRAETGEVEMFQIEDLHDGPPLADHDARHDRAAADVARVVENNALIEETFPGAEPATPRTTRTAGEGAGEQREQRLRD